MDAVRSLAAIDKIDDDCVAHFSPDDRAQNAKPLGLWFAGGERRVRIFDISRLWPLRLQGPGPGNHPSVNQVPPAGRVIPREILGRNVVVTSRGHTWGQGEKSHAGK